MINTAADLAARFTLTTLADIDRRVELTKRLTLADDNMNDADRSLKVTKDERQAIFAEFTAARDAWEAFTGETAHWCH